MKFNKFLIPVLLLGSACSLSACDFPWNNPGGDDPDNPSDPSDSGEKEKEATYITVLPGTYATSNKQTNMDTFYNETKQSDGSSHDDPLDYGFVPSVWHTLKINGVDCPVYSTRCGFNVHSFAYVNIDTDGAFTLNAEVKVSGFTFAKTKILPEKRNTKTSISDTTITFSMTELTDYTLCFGDPTIGPEHALTIYLAPETAYSVPSGYDEVIVEPGTYDDDSSTETKALPLTNAKTVYHFKKGYYDINSFGIPNDSIIYFDRGCYLDFRQDDDKACFYNKGKSFKILGNAIVDMSRCMGGDKKTKGAYSFSGLTSAYMEGIININSHTWTVCFSDSDNIEVNRIMLFGYRTYSDGIMLAGCTESTVHNNFVRTGDDAIEAKATTNRVVSQNNLLYENNTVWTDKANAYGCIYENNADINGIVFRNNSVGFAQSSWSKHLGCFTMQLGTNYKHTWQNVHFEDSEVYYCANQIMNIYNVTYTIFSYGVAENTYGGTIKNIYFKNITCARKIQTGVEPHALSINYLSDDEDTAYEKLHLGKIYIDNVSYCGTKLTPENYKTYSLIDVNAGLGWSTGNIKVNTLTTEE